MKNSKRLGRQARPGFELGTCRLPVLSVEPLRHFWVTISREAIKLYFIKRKFYNIFFSICRINRCNKLLINMPIYRSVQCFKSVPKDLKVTEHF